MSEQPERPDTTPMTPLDAPEALQLGIVPLRPLALPDLVAGMAQGLRRNAAALIGVGFAVITATELLRWFVSTLVFGDVPDARAITDRPRLDWAEVRPLLADAALHAVIAALLGLLLVAVVNVVVPRAVFGHTTGARAALGAALPALPRLLLLALLTAVVFGAIAAVAVFAVFAGGSAGLLLALPAVAAMFYLVIAFTFAQSIVVVEGGNPVAALERSRRLVAAVGWWRVLGILLLAGVVFGLLGMIVSAVFGRISGGGALAEALAAVLSGTLISPATLVLQSLLYVDHRSRVEGIEGLWRKAG
ncbi:hypothetical protein [Actinokineospora iranica]|uniref:Membrane domain of glycerophosphoryl diester phosphodiesterase n=1 Tax=Actinokineospora iranica TaxID=1271860 RepID=A0A1G6NG29_9PSEU|nr:hypothetical protein [Actinokineospora iranica]SDC66819.1 hypothetical protein SAMN05216174_103349 [Actinokineospora iranica]